MVTSTTHKGLGTFLTLSVTGGNGSGLIIAPGDARTTTGGLVTATVDNTGTGYQVGDQITVSGGNGDAVFEVATIKTSSLPSTETDNIVTQNNYIVLPDSVIGVNRILNKSGSTGIGGTIPGVAFFNPFLVGGLGGMGQMV